MAYKFYLYRGAVFQGATYSLLAEAAEKSCKQLYDKIFSDFSSISAIGGWVTIDPYVDSGGYHHEGIKRYFCIDDSNERQMAVILRSAWQQQSVGYRYYNFNYTIAAAHEENDSDQGDGWEITPDTVNAHWYENNTGTKWQGTDYWQIIVFTDENDKVVGISAPECYWNSGGSIRSFKVIMFDRKNENMIPGCSIKALSTTGYFLGSYKTPYDIIGRINPETRSEFSMSGSKAIKTASLYNDMFHNTFAMDSVTDLDAYTFINSNWNNDCWDRTIIVDDQSYQNIGMKMFVPISEKNQTEIYINNVPVYPD